jgi:uncharacterized protein (DUF608 family)
VGRTPSQTVHSGEVVDCPDLRQGFVLQVRSSAGSVRRTLDQDGFPGVRFCGEYPFGRVEYSDEGFPVDVQLLAFSPFIPLNSADSSLPATVLRYMVRNTTNEPVEVDLAGWLENAACYHNGRLFGEGVIRRNRALDSSIVTGFFGAAEAVPLPEPMEEREPIVFADFEGEDYGDWTVEGEAFGTGPARGTLENQNPVSRFDGQGLVNTYLGGDGPHGRLTSPSFTIERPWIAFLVGGGGHEGRTCMNLVVDGEVLRTTTGLNTEALEPRNWNVEDLMGREARLEIVDEESGGWGHINIDQIEFRDGPRHRDPGVLEDWNDFGSFCLAVLGDGRCLPSLPEGSPEATALGDATGPTDKSLEERLVGAVGTTLHLGPGEEGTATFVLSWFMPNMYRNESLVGNHYANLFSGADAVVTYVAERIEELTAQTRLWHRTFYDSTLPYWLLDRVHSTVANLATATTQWWKNGRFWAWEGAGCCQGTCGHVWNYEHALARLFPDLERSVREMQDFASGIGFYPETGAIGFRGEGWTLWAGDSQGGYVLKALREHQTSPDDAFLRRNWPNIRKATEFLIQQDANADGMLEGAQHQTYDENYYGANTMVGSLYLGALRAAEEMARDVGDDGFAAGCRGIFEAGRAQSVERLFNGEYFIQDVDLEEHPDWQYGDGCLADQLFGQGWAHQVGLGYIYPEDTVRTTLESIWNYCWAPNIGPQNEAHDPERWFALPGEAGLFTCTWPKSRHLGPRSTRYRNEIWTGIEYQVAGHMAWEGMLTEALAICRGIHERYHPSKHNPWNEIECGDHYARALASWTMITGLSGFEYHGPKRHLGFAPRITPEDFRCAFTAAEGWGSLGQTQGENGQRSHVSVHWGKVPVTSISLQVPDGAQVPGARVALDGVPIAATVHQDGRRITLTLPDDTVIEEGATLSIGMRW